MVEENVYMTAFYLTVDSKDSHPDDSLLSFHNVWNSEGTADYTRRCAGDRTI